MLTLRRIVVVAALAVILRSIVVFPAAAEAIHVSYHWAGLGPRHAESYDIVRNGDHYTATAVFLTSAFGAVGTEDTVEHLSFDVSPAAVDALIAALRAPVMSKKKALASLTKPEWLRSNTAEAYRSITTAPCADGARAFFAHRFQDPHIAQKALDNYFTGMWTDDYPWASVEIDLPHTGKVERSTTSQKAFMLPWRNGNRDDWNPALAHAVAALLPENSAGKGRLLGKHLLSQLADYVLSDARREWEDLEQRCIFRDVIAKLDPLYKVVGIYGSSGNFNTYLQSADMPHNLAINAALPAEDGKVPAIELETFLKLGPRYAEQAQAFATAHPETRFTIWYSGQHSFDERDIDSERDLKLDQQHPVARPIPPGSVMLYEHDYMYGKRWVVTPTGEVILWRERPKWDKRRPGPGW